MIITILLILMSPSNARANEKLDSVAIKVEIKFTQNKDIIVEIDDKSAIIDLSNHVAAAGALEGIVVLSNYKAGKYYLFIDLHGPSRFSDGLGYCGAGEEFNFIWFKLNNSLDLEEIKSILYSSCLKTIDVDVSPELYDQRYQVQNNVLNLKYTSYSEEPITSYSIYYDSMHPENGFTVTRVPTD